jgi:hypothetical protein
MMRTLLTIASLAALTTLPSPFVQDLAAQGQGPRPRPEQRRSDDRPSQSEKISRTLNLGADGEIDIANISGDIVVSRNSGNSVVLEIVKTARAGTEAEAKEALNFATVDVVERGTRAEIRARYPGFENRRGDRRGMRVDVAMRIAAPAGTRISVKSISGGITVSDIAGALALETVSGSVRLSNTGRLATAKSISGDIEMADSKADGALSAGSVSGTVRLRGVTARTLSLSTVSGNVNVEDVTSERVDAQAISGNVAFVGNLAPNGRYEFTSHSGNVRVAVDGKTGFQLEATSFSGGISSDLPITTEGGRQPRSLRGKFGDGSAILELTSFSGSIIITKR